MNVAIVTNQTPFVRGGAELLAETLRDQLVLHGHESQVVRLPFAWSPPARIAEHMLASRLIRLGNTDHVIALKFPAYYVEHESKVVWLLHQFRQAYDVYDAPGDGLADKPSGPAIEGMIQRADGIFLRAAKAVFTNSEITRDRLKRFNDIDSTVLLPPLWDDAGYRCEDYGDYILALGRISPAKRQNLLIEAMEHTTTDVRLVVAGAPENDALGEWLAHLAADSSARDRITLIPRWISDEEKLDLLAGALACAYVPFDEDSYGYVTLESFRCRKPVVTSTDAGGVLTIVEDGETGYVVEPEPQALAAAFDRLREGSPPAAVLGGNAGARLDGLQLSWSHVIDTLLP